VPALRDDKLGPLGLYIRSGLEQHYGKGNGTAMTLASVVGCSQSAAGRWMTGKNIPSGTTLQVIATKLDLDLAQMHQLAGKMPPEPQAGRTDELSAMTRRHRILATHLDWLMSFRSPLSPHQRDDLYDQLTALADAWDQVAGHDGA
jgi:hypothetical protein